MSCMIVVSPSLIQMALQLKYMQTLCRWCLKESGKILLRYFHLLFCYLTVERMVLMTLQVLEIYMVSHSSASFFFSFGIYTVTHLLKIQKCLQYCFFGCFSPSLPLLSQQKLRTPFVFRQLCFHSNCSLRLVCTLLLRRYEK